MAISLANEKDISLVLANDPDADRFCAAERTHENKWHIFSGNEMGIILAYHVFNQCKRQSHFDIGRSILSYANFSSIGNVVFSSFIKNATIDGQEGGISP